MEQQKEHYSNDEEKLLKEFYTENMLRNKYKISNDLSKIMAKLISDFNEKFFEDFDADKIKHIRNAQSNLCIATPIKDIITKFTFFIGLMDKDTLTYKYSKKYAKQKVSEILGDCTIQECSGFYTPNNNQTLEIETLLVTKFLKEVPDNYLHTKVRELKNIFNQNSIITETTNSYSIKLNNETPEYVKKVETLMSEYDWSWDVACDAFESGLL